MGLDFKPLDLRFPFHPHLLVPEDFHKSIFSYLTLLMYLSIVSRTTSPPGEPLVRAPAGKPRCPPAISRLRVEKVEGGLAVAGVVVAANCQIVLPIFGFLFMLVGCVLTGKVIFSAVQL